MSFRQQLIDMCACSEAVNWVGRKGLKRCWADCERGDWMIWLLDNVGWPDKKTEAAVAYDIAERVLHLTREEHREVRRAWINGKATENDCQVAVRAAWATAWAAWAAETTAWVAEAPWAAEADIIRTHVSYEHVAQALERVRSCKTKKNDDGK